MTPPRDESEWGFVWEFDVIPFTASLAGTPQQLPDGWEPMQVLADPDGVVLVIRRRLVA